MGSLEGVVIVARGISFTHIQGQSEGLGVILQGCKINSRVSISISTFFSPGRRTKDSNLSKGSLLAIGRTVEATKIDPDHECISVEGNEVVGNMFKEISC